MFSFYKNDFFVNDKFLEIKKFVLDNSSDLAQLEYSESFGRYYKYVVLPDSIKSDILDAARTEIKDQEIDIAYCQIVRYQPKGGVVPEIIEHRDAVTGVYVMDISIDGTVKWPLKIEDTSIDCIPNSVIFLRGELDTHKRDPFPSTNEEDFLLLLFVHLAPKDSHYIKLSKDLYGMKQEDVEAFFKAVKPIWRNKQQDSRLNVKL